MNFSVKINVGIKTRHTHSADLKVGPKLIARNYHLRKYIYKISQNYTYGDFIYCPNTVLHGTYHKHRLYEFQTFLLVTILFNLVEKMMFLLTLHVYKLKMGTVTVLSS